MKTDQNILGHKIVGHGDHKVIVLSGWLGDHTVFSPTFDFLSTDLFSYAFVDYRGYGQSKDILGEYTLAEIAADIEKLADSLKWSEFSIVGHSMGGVAATKVASLMPERVQSIVAITPVPPSGFPMDPDTEGLFLGAVESDDNRRAILDFTTGGKREASWLDSMVTSSRENTLLAAFASYLDAWRLANLTSEVKNLKIPTLVCYGEHDQAVTKKFMRASFIEEMPITTLRHLKNCGHYPMQETPKILTSIIEEYLERDFEEKIGATDSSEDAQFIKNVIDVNLFGASVATLEGELIYANESLLNMFKTRSEDFIGRKASEFYKHRGDREQIVKALEKDGIVKDIDIELKRDDGSTFWASLSFLKSKFAGKNSYFCWFYDLTPRLVMEEKLEEQRKLTFHNAKLASIGKLASGVGHEINNPLSIIKIIADLLGKEAVAQKPDHSLVKTYNLKMSIAIGRILNIVKGLRTLSRSDTAHCGPFDIVQPIDESVSLVKEIYEADGLPINYQKEITGTEIHINGNRGKFQQVLMNLFSNARDSQEGNAEKRIDVTVKELGSRVEITVRDLGSGIPKEIQESIFDPFFTTKGVDKGTGIGLAIASTIISEHNGTIGIASSSSEGTEFLITLPKP